MSTAYADEARPLLVPCTTNAAHAFLRPETCPECGGRCQRPAEDVEYVLCDERNHEHELRAGDTAEPELEGLAPDRDDNGTGAVWSCTYRGCGGTIILTRVGA